MLIMKRTKHTMDANKNPITGSLGVKLAIALMMGNDPNIIATNEYSETNKAVKIL